MLPYSRCLCSGLASVGNDVSGAQPACQFIRTLSALLFSAFPFCFPQGHAGKLLDLDFGVSTTAIFFFTLLNIPSRFCADFAIEAIFFAAWPRKCSLASLLIHGPAGKLGAVSFPISLAFIQYQSAGRQVCMMMNHCDSLQQQACRPRGPLACRLL